jgi:uncharacterized protein (DUF697 family)
MNNSTLIHAAYELAKTMDKAVDDSLPGDIAGIVKFHSKGAAISGIASGWIPGAGAVAAVAISAGFVWTMYGRINSKIDLPFTENIIKSVGSGIATNLAAYIAGGIIIPTALSFVPTVGSAAAAIIVGSTCYALTLASGFVYLKVLTRVFKAGKDPTAMTAENLKDVAKNVIENEDIKAVMKEAKKHYKDAKASGEIQKEARA